ncbi:MAG: IS1182 family transposase [Acidimicrobiales bacterium]|jgi:IS5 family transposase
MALGSSQTQQRFENPKDLLGDRLKAGSIYRLLADHGHEMFPDDYFADLYSDSIKGRPTIPARVMATVMLLQAFEGLSDREACDRLGFDLRWQAAAGVDTGAEAFHSTALVGQRNRLRASVRPRRLFEDTKIVAGSTGAMKGRARVLDSTPIHDAVATEDTVTQLRASIRKLLRSLDQAASPLAQVVRASLQRDDDYATSGKPPCDWDDPLSRESLVDDLVGDCLSALEVLEDNELPESCVESVELVALVSGQDVEQGDDGVFRIAKGVARDRMISTVDRDARHGHKSRNRRFDGYKAHLSIDPDSELIDEVVATPANTPDRDAVAQLLGEHENEKDKPVVFGDSAYADGATRKDLEESGFELVAKTPPVRNSTGLFAKDRFKVDLDNRTVTCPANNVVAIVVVPGGAGRANFKAHCASCPMRPSCTKSRKGRTISIHRFEAILQRARHAQADPIWKAAYRADRPVVERKIAHFTRRQWGGRKARTRGLARIRTDLDTRAGAVNWARLAVLGLHRGDKGWAVT